MALRGSNFGFDDDSAPTRAKPVNTPTVKYKDPVRGRQPDSFFALGDKGQDISAKVERWSRNNGRAGKC